jgi:hypothetical protein
MAELVDAPDLGLARGGYGVTTADVGWCHTCSFSTERRTLSGRLALRDHDEDAPSISSWAHRGRRHCGEGDEKMAVCASAVATENLLGPVRGGWRS